MDWKFSKFDSRKTSQPKESFANTQQLLVENIAPTVKNNSKTSLNGHLQIADVFMGTGTFSPFSYKKTSE